MTQGEPTTEDVTNFGCAALLVTLLLLGALGAIGRAVWLKLRSPNPAPPEETVQVRAGRMYALRTFTPDGRNHSLLVVDEQRPAGDAFQFLIGCTGVPAQPFTALSHARDLMNVQAWQGRVPSLNVAWGRGQPPTWEALPVGRSLRDDNGDGNAQNDPHLKVVTLGADSPAQARALRELFGQQGKLHLRLTPIPGRGAQVQGREVTFDLEGLPEGLAALNNCQPRTDRGSND